MSFLHNAVDDHSRLAYSEILTDEKKEPPSDSGNGPTTSSPPPGSPSSGS
jgi:hypothetical protein